jgi:hypothetical protein
MVCALTPLEIEPTKLTMYICCTIGCCDSITSWGTLYEDPCDKWLALWSAKESVGMYIDNTRRAKQR